MPSVLSAFKSLVSRSVGRRRDTSGGVATTERSEVTQAATTERSGVTQAAAAGDAELVENVFHAAGSAQPFPAAAELDLFDDYGQTPLLNAITEHNQALAQELLRAGADKDLGEEGWGATPLLLAAERGQAGVVRMLLDARCDIEKTNVRGHTPLYGAAKGGSVAVIRDLLAAGSNLEKASVSGCTPLLVASIKGNADAVRELIAAGACKDRGDNDDNTSLYAAAKEGHVDVVRILLAARCNTEIPSSRSGRTPLLAAAWIGNRTIVRELIEAGCDKDRMCKDGCTALIHAALLGHEDVVRELLEAGCDIEKSESGGGPVINFATHKESMARALLAAGCDTSHIVKVCPAQAIPVFVEHFERLFTAFAMASHPRLGADASSACQALIMHEDILQAIFQTMLACTRTQA
jgi:ankyrin repeat protein